IEEDISKVEALVDVLVYVLIGVDVGVLVLAELGVGAESGTEEVVTAASKVTLLETRLFGTLVVLVVLVALVLMFGLGLDGLDDLDGLRDKDGGDLLSNVLGIVGVVVGVCVSGK